MTAKDDKRFTTLDLNLLNYPVADWRTSRSWRWAQQDDGWIVGTPTRDTGYVFELPPGTRVKYRRPPTGFEMNVLLMLMSIAHMSKSNVIEFGSIPHLLAKMDMAASGYNCQRAREALAYLKRVRIRFLKWYCGAGQYKQFLIRPLKQVDYLDARFIVSLSPVLAEIPKGRFRRVHLPLPNHATAQKIVMCMLAWPWHRERSNADDRMRLSPNRRSFMRKIGLGANHNRSSKFKKAMDLALLWFEDVGGWRTTWNTEDDGRTFFYQRKRRPDDWVDHDYWE